MDDLDHTTGYDRMARPKSRAGRPRAGELPEMEPAKLLTGNKMPPMICPCCGRGMQPRVKARRPSGEITAECSANGCVFVYREPQVRLLKS